MTALNESTLARMGVRAALALMLVCTVCLLSIVEVGAAIYMGELPSVSEPLRSMALLALGFYFGQKQPSTQTPPNNTTTTATA